MMQPRNSQEPERRRRGRPLRGPALDSLFRLLRWAGRHAHGLYTAVGLYLVVGLALSLLALGSFAALAEGILRGHTHQIDTATVVWMHRHRTAGMDALALAGAALGSGVALWLVLTAGTLLLGWSRHWLSVALLWVSLLGGRVMIHALKAWFDRPRPQLFGSEIQVFGYLVPYPQSASFPSGHALGAVVIYGTLAYLVARLERGRRLRRWTLGTAVGLVGLIGWSRVYLGVHYPSDVLAGYMAGFAWATFCAFGIEAIRYFRTREPGVGRLEQDLEEGMEPIRDAVTGEAEA